MQRRAELPRRAGRGPLSDRWSYKPVAVFLLLAVIAATSVLFAVVIAPPFIGAGLGVNELGKRLDAAGADFTHIPKPPQRSTIYANDGKTVLARVYLDNRVVVPLREISPVAVKAVLAIEDSSFYEHGALNISSLFRATIENLRAGNVVQGGSTITQQLVKNTLEVDPNSQTLARKFQEAALAMKVEQRYSKDQILAMYLNQVYLGNNVYGIGTASEFYFHKPASKLNLREGAMLAGLIRAPAYYDPLVRPHKAWLRRNDVLNRMMALGPKWLTQRRGEHAKSLGLGLAPNAGSYTLPQPPFLVDYVKQQIIDDPNGWYRVLGSTPKERERKLKEGGLDIVTTFDADWYQAAVTAANQPWARTPYHPDHFPPADVGIVSIDVPTGAIKMMLSGKHYKQDRVNTVTSLHQPGSSFKPYVLATAFEQGIPPTATYSGAQGPITDPRCETKGQPWDVTNAEGSSLGMLNLYQATADSVNAVFARLILDAGPENVVEVAHKMGITSYLPPVCALATGSVGISPLDQASGYQTLANQGVHCLPYAVQQIKQGDQILYTARPDCTRAIPSAIANLITDMLKGVINGGTATSAFLGWGPWPIVGKTGTASDNTNVWFAGYTRQVATAVWVGSQGAPYPLSEYWGYDVFGGSIAAPIWRAYMAQVMKGYPVKDFPQPDLVYVPNVVGKSEADATSLLRQAGFSVATQTVGSYLPAGTVAQQSPPGGSQTVPHATVTLGISNGVAPISAVPNVVGMSVGDATSTLQASHFQVTVVERVVSDKTNDGIVLRQDPAGGASVAEGSTITIYVGKLGGPPSPTPTPPPGGGGGGGG